MKILFKNNSEITKKEIMRFNYFNLFRNKLLIIILLYMPVVWTASGIGMFFKNSDGKRLIISLIFSSVWLALIFLPPYMTVKMKYKVEDYVNEYEFYEDTFKASNKFNMEEINYLSIYKVYETKSNYYFYLDKKNVLVLDKNKFEFGYHENFSLFIKEKLNKRYKKVIF
ncbi:YcxB-like protein [Clostridium sp. DSM 8431]|uniref:YcxB family protein n=1 Tax=Clostridium sp. DSM 8431 TaxID=1761781 RepID=UPI0008F35884|nr:YcxB family protein [Clostridium sp. DSM 8431]SFU51238.1 YcxB-like protein [Clostridium sp. DSM 8431]